MDARDPVAPNNWISFVSRVLPNFKTRYSNIDSTVVYYGSADLHGRASAMEKLVGIDLPTNL